MFLMLVGITLMSYISLLNDTLEKVAVLFIIFSKRKPHLMPVIIFLSALLLSAIGAGNIAATALIAPFALTLASRVGLNLVMTIILICTGANAGTFSPVATTGRINNGLMNKIGIDSSLLSTDIFLFRIYTNRNSSSGIYNI